MNEIIEKLNIAKDRIISERGNTLKIFVLIRRFDLENKWDLIIGADWAEERNKEKDLIFFIEILKKSFDNNLNFLSQIEILNTHEIFIQQISRAIIEQGFEEETDISDLRISPNFLVGEIYIIKFDMDEEDLIPEMLQSGEIESKNRAPNF
jgi:hypothetical protein